MIDQSFIVETALLLLVALVLGGAIGFLAQRWFAPRDVAHDEAKAEAAPVVAETKAEADHFVPQQPIAEPPPVLDVAPANEVGKPELLSAAREGGPDDLKKIKGVGPKLETMLHGVGVYHYDQIAAWGSDEIAWMDEKLSFRGRIERENWVEQAKSLASR